MLSSSKVEDTVPLQQPKGPGMTDEAKQGATAQAWQALPSITAIAAWLSGLTVEKWLGMAGIAFLLLQMAGYVWRWRRDIRKERARARAVAMARHAADGQELPKG